MNDLIRPSLYRAWQAIVAVDEHPSGAPGVYDLVGPICETGDFLGKGRPLTLREGSLLAVRSAGAYGFTMASNYNTRPRAAELMVDGEQVHLVRRRETLSELFASEATLPN
jgi:diaminopimelate decarboxylase